MPELPDVAVYIESLASKARGQVLKRLRILNPFVLRSALPPRAAAMAIESLVDGLISNWLMEPLSFDLVRVGEQGIDAYLRGLSGGAR